MKYCIGCKKNDLKKIIRFGKMPLSNDFLNSKNKSKVKKYELGLNFCKNCYLLQISKIINNKKIFNKNYLYYSSYSKSWLNHSKQLANTVIRKFNLNEKSEVLEIASNDGYLLQYFKKKNIKCYGIEPSLGVAKVAKAKGIKTYVKFFNLNFIKKFKKKLKPKIIFALNVLAHTPNLNEFIKSLSLIMSDKTICIAEFPSLLNLVNKKQIDTIYHEHYSYFSLTSIQNILNIYNLSVYDYEKIYTHGGSLRVFIKKIDSKNSISKKVNELLLKEKRFGLKKINFFKNFSFSINELINKNRKKIEKICSKYKVVGYGAAAKSTIICNLMKLNNNKIKFIYDNNKFKQNRYIPGTNIKIAPPEQIKKDNPTHILIFVWNIKEEVINLLKKKFNIKSKFITFEPCLKITK